MSGAPSATDRERSLGTLTPLDAGLQALGSTADMAEILQNVLEHARQVTSAEGLSLLLYDHERDELVFAATETLQENALVCRETPLPPAVGSLMSPERLVVPIRTEEHVLGTIDLRLRYDGRPFDETDRGRAAAVAAELAARPGLERMAHEPDVLQAVFARLAAAVPSQEAAIVVYDRERRELAFRVSHALRHGVIDGVRLRIGQGIVGWVAAQRQAVRLDDASRDPRHDPQIARRTGLVPRSMLCVPMVHGDTLHGVIQVINKLDGSVFDDDELRLVQTLADHAAIAIESALRDRQATEAALTDELTGLGNARRLDSVLPALLERGGPLSLLRIDVDLHGVVDDHGESVGRRAMAGVGQVIGARLRPGDVAARCEGDGFVVILPATAGATARVIADEFRAAIDACSIPGAPGVRITSRVGVATYPDDGGDAEALLQSARAAAS